MPRLEDVILRDTRANQPAATDVPIGTLFGVTDEDNIIERSNGTTWDAYSTVGGGGDVTGPASATDNALVRFDSTTGKLLQNSVITVGDTGIITLPDDIRQVFNPGTNAAGLNVGAAAANPGTPVNGDLYYDSVNNQLMAYINSVWYRLGIRGFYGASVRKAADQTGANYTAGVTIAWDQETFDTGGWHDTVTNNSRMTVPTGLGITKVVCTANVRIQNITSGQTVSFGIMKNGSLVYDGVIVGDSVDALTSLSKYVSGGPIDCVAGDYFEAWLFVNSDTSIDIIATRSSFAIMAVG